MTLNALDLSFVRSRFPALDSEWILMDNAGGSQTLQGSIDRMSEYLSTSNVQHGGTYALAQLAADRVRMGVRALASFVNAADPAEIIVGPSSTQLLYNLGRAFEGRLEPGDEIVVANIDHESNINPWMRLAEQGVVIKIWKMDCATRRMRLEDLDRLMTKRTRLVAFTHVSNILGEINPVADIIRFIHGKGALACVDGVAMMPHQLVDVQEIDADFYVFSMYKVYGPHVAALYGKRSCLEGLASINHFFLGDDLPYKLQPGGPQYELVYGCLGVREYFEELALRLGAAPSDPVRTKYGIVNRALADYEQTLTAPLLDFLSRRSGIDIIAPVDADREQCVATISFTVQGMPSDTVVRALESRFIGTRSGHFYAQRLIADMGLEAWNGVVRISLAHYNTPQEVGAVIAALDEIVP